MFLVGRKKPEDPKESYTDTEPAMLPVALSCHPRTNMMSSNLKRNLKMLHCIYDFKYWSMYKRNHQ